MFWYQGVYVLLVLGLRSHANSQFTVRLPWLSVRVNQYSMQTVLHRHSHFTSVACVMHFSSLLSVWYWLIRTVLGVITVKCVYVMLLSRSHCERISLMLIKTALLLDYLFLWISCSNLQTALISNTNWMTELMRMVIQNSPNPYNWYGCVIFFSCTGTVLQFIGSSLFQRTKNPWPRRVLRYCS